MGPTIRGCHWFPGWGWGPLSGGVTGFQDGGRAHYQGVSLVSRMGVGPTIRGCHWFSGWGWGPLSGGVTGYQDGGGTQPK